MSRSKVLFYAVLFIFIPSLAFSDAGYECNEKSYTKTESHDYKGVKCDMTLAMYQDQGCVRYAKTFELTMTGAVNRTVKCADHVRMFALLGTSYTCQSGSKTKTFDWRVYGTRENTCHIFTDWLLALPNP